MRPNFHPRLVNGPFEDPALFIPFRFEKRAILFDMGNLANLSSRELLKITHAFVTHTHMDHFMGFDNLLRVFLGRSATLHLFGPPGFFAHVEGRLSGYTWNLVSEFSEELYIRVSEVHPQNILTKTYGCRTGFKPTGPLALKANTGTLWEEPSFSVRGVLVDHRIPCLALALEERIYVNIIKEGLKALELPVGPWLNRFKQAIYEGQDLGSSICVTWTKGGQIIREKRIVLGELVPKIAKISHGRKISYVVDMVASKENEEKVLELIEGSDLLFIEAAFLHEDKDLACRKYHLTAREAGLLARKAGVKKLKVFHFSPRYEAKGREVEQEAMAAFLDGPD